MVQEKRTRKAMVTLEVSVHEAASNYAARLDTSLSSYVRGLVVRDLVDKGLLSESDILRLASGG